MANPSNSFPVSSFGILGETLAPTVAELPPAANPYLVQGYFVQITYCSASRHSIDLTLTLHDKGSFAADAPRPRVLCDYVFNDDGPVLFPGFPSTDSMTNLLTLKTTSLASTPDLGTEDTVVFGIQALPTPSGTGDSKTYTPNFGWHGYSTLTATSAPGKKLSGSLIITATQRLVYYDTPALGTVTNSTVYSVPIVGGNPEISL